MKTLLIVLFFWISFYTQEKIVFTKNREIHIMNIDGSNVQQLTDYKVPGHTPVSLRASIGRSRKIAYIYDPIRHGWMSTYLMNFDGSETVRISKEPNSKNSSTWDAVISPDGKYYVFRSAPSNNWEIFRMNSDGSNVVNISNSNIDDGPPKWAPDSKDIIWTTNSDELENKIMKSDLAGKNNKVLLTLKGKLRNATLSKDGKKLAYIIQNSKSSDLMIANADGSASKKLRTIAKWSRLSFSPDNLKITFVAENGLVAIASLDGSSYKELIQGIDPVWSFN